MIVMLEEPEAWSLMMLVSAVAVDNAEISNEAGKPSRSGGATAASSPELAKLTDDLNKALNAHLDAKLLRRVKSKGRYETVKQ